MGANKQNAGKTIPVSRTTSPLDIYPAFTKLTNDVDDINTTELSKAFRTLADDFPGTPTSVRPVSPGCPGCPRPSPRATQQLRTLLAAGQPGHRHAGRPRPGPQQLLSDGNLLLDELNARRDAIHSLLINTQVLSTQLRGLVADNQKTIGPLLDNLDKMLKLLQQQRGQPRPRPVAARPVLPGVQQRRRQRPLVRQLHPEPQPVRRRSASPCKHRSAC